MNDFTRTIEQDRLELLLRFPFFGKCICHCEILPVRQNDVLSCNDCRRIYLAAEIYCNLAQSQRLWLLSHEVCHIVLRHAFRKGERDEERFNFAADAEISFLLNGEDLSPVYTLSVASDWKGLTAEEIYDKLPDNNIPDNIPMHCYPSGTSGVADKVDGKSVENEAGGEYPVGGSYNNGDDTAKDSGNNGTSPREFSTQNSVGDPCSNFDIETELFCRQLAEEAKLTNIFSHDGRGDGIGEILEMLEKLETGKVDWRSLLRQFIRECRGGSYRWLPPNRRYISKGLYLPGRKQKIFRGIVALDTSGSTVDKLPEFAGEVDKLLRSFGKFKLTVLECDTAVRNVTEITSEQPSYYWNTHQFSGGGGTDFTPVFEYIRRKRLRPEVLIFFTDGDGRCPKNRPEYPVLWLLTDDGEAPVEWGFTVKMKG